MVFGADNSASPGASFSRKGEGCECGGREWAHTRVQERRSKPRFSRVPAQAFTEAVPVLPARVIVVGKKW